MIDAISTAAAGLRTSANQFEKAAQKVVKATTPEAGETAAADPSSGGDDLASAIVDTNMSALSFKANAAVFKTGDKMMGTLLDTIA
jgi:hypothetical protein